MYGHQPHHGNHGQHRGAAYGHRPYNQLPGQSHALANTSGYGPMRGGPWPAPSTGLSLDDVKTWLDQESLGVKHKWWALGIGTLTVGALVYHGRKARWF